MPELRSYVDDSPKSGHYILANVGGTHPITIQVTDLGEQILQKAGYDGGDNVPTKVVWSMFDIGILYTPGTINEPPETVDSPDETFQQLGVANELTRQEQDQLVSYLDEYTGPNQAEVDDLRDTLENSTTATQSESAMPEELSSDLGRLSRLHSEGELKDEEYRLLKSNVSDQVESTSGSKSTPKLTTENETSKTNPEESSSKSTPAKKSELASYIQDAYNQNNRLAIWSSKLNGPALHINGDGTAKVFSNHANQLRSAINHTEYEVENTWEEGIRMVNQSPPSPEHDVDIVSSIMKDLFHISESDHIEYHLI